MTTLNIKKLDEKAVMPTVLENGNSFDLTCINIATGVGRDGRLVLEYRTGLEIEIPEGHVGMLFLADSGYVNSLALTNAVATFLSDSPKEIIARFKTNTDSVPAIYEVGEVFAKMIILELPKVEITEVFEQVKESEILENNIEEVNEVPEDGPILETLEINE